jgi:hypothetical protein
LAFKTLNCLMISEEDLPRFVAVDSSSAMTTVQTLFVRLSCAVVYVYTGEEPDKASRCCFTSRATCHVQKKLSWCLVGSNVVITSLKPSQQRHQTPVLRGHYQRQFPCRFLIID